MPRSKPVVVPIAEEVWARLGAWSRADVGEWDLLIYLDAMLRPLQELVDLVRDSPTHPGWGRLLDVDAAPEWALPWLAQFVGVTPLKGLDATSQRIRIKEAAGFNRGSPTAIRAAARQFLTGSRRVEVYERDGSPWRFRVRTYLAETPNPRAVYEAIVALKPAGLVFIHEVQAGVTIDSVDEGTINGYTQTIASFSNTVPTGNDFEFGTPYGSGRYGRGTYGGI